MHREITHTSKDGAVLKFECSHMQSVHGSEQEVVSKNHRYYNNFYIMLHKPSLLVLKLLRSATSYIQYKLFKQVNAKQSIV